MNNLIKLVSLNNFSPSATPVNLGMSQGFCVRSVLVLVNDLCYSSDISKFLPFTDDTNVNISSSDMVHIHNDINNELGKLAFWHIAKCLSINVKY